MTNDEFELVYYPKYRVEIAKLANKLIGGSMPDLVPDLIQEGLICLWKLDLQGVTNEESYVRQAVKFTMIDYLRKLPRMASEKTLQYLQIVNTGEPLPTNELSEYMYQGTDNFHVLDEAHRTLENDS